jgi:hypothetical protein
MTQATTIGARVVHFFFMQIGSLVTIIVYFTIYGGSGNSPEGLRAALWIALGVQSAYVVTARWKGELKQFDIGFWLMFAVGAVAVLVNLQPIVTLFRAYSPVILFVTLGLTASLPPLLGYDPFTAYFMRRTLPRWQLKLPLTGRIGSLMTAFWALLFFVAAALCAYAPLDWRFTALYPNLLIFGVGMSANKWLPAFYLKLFPPGPPPSVEAAIMGMPLVFDARAASGVRAMLQFRVSGAEPGNYWLRIANGRCESFEGDAPAPNVTVYTPDTVWIRIVRRELDGAQALASGLFRTEGDATILAALGTWFPAQL